MPEDITTTHAWNLARTDRIADVALMAKAAVTDEEVRPTRGIAFSAEGALVVEINNASVTIPSGVLAAGVIHPLSVTKVKTGTEATNVWLFW